MPLPSSLAREPVCAPSDALGGELADAITEAVGRSEDLPARSEMICTLVREIYESAVWLHDADADPDELASLAQVVVAAHAHHLRMVALHGTGS